MARLKVIYSRPENKKIYFLKVSVYLEFWRSHLRSLNLIICPDNREIMRKQTLNSLKSLFTKKNISKFIFIACETQIVSDRVWYRTGTLWRHSKFIFCLLQLNSYILLCSFIDIGVVARNLCLSFFSLFLTYLSKCDKYID